jgi:hypothetical protein
MKTFTKEELRTLNKVRKALLNTGLIDAAYYNEAYVDDSGAYVTNRPVESLPANYCFELDEMVVVVTKSMRRCGFVFESYIGGEPVNNGDSFFVVVDCEENPKATFILTRAVMAEMGQMTRLCFGNLWSGTTREELHELGGVL